MKNSFEGSYGGRSDHREQNQREKESGDFDIERIADIAKRVKQFAAEFEEAIEPAIAMNRKGDRANWIDAASSLYAAGKFALPRIMKGVNTLDEYLNKGKK